MVRCKYFHPVLMLLMFCWVTFSQMDGQISSQPFEFEFEGKTLSGLIEMPEHKKSQAIVLLIPGYGKTDFVEGQWYSGLRNKLVDFGLTVCLWDKMGCGKSEGVFNAQQPVENSADEAIAAIQKIKSLKIRGADKIGIWGVSRAGWICPLINEKFPIDFWISVSGTDDKENFGYLLKSNLIIQGKKEEDVQVLFNAWMEGHKIFCTDSSYENYLNAIQALSQDSLCRALFGYSGNTEVTEEGRKEYLLQQKLFTSKGYFDAKSGLWVYIEQFDKMLKNINCPVLAIFGENDAQVDWRKTKSLYEKTIGKNSKARLTVKTFKKCNHNLQECITCGYQEDLSALNWRSCNGYYQSMEEWLKSNKIVK